jgi:hypothetical protein
LLSIRKRRNNMNKTLVISVIALVVALGAVAFPRTVTNTIERVSDAVGASGTGQNTTSLQTFSAGLVQGGVYSTTTTASSFTLPARAISEASVINIGGTSVNSPVQTVLLPASTTWQGLDQKGDSQTWIIDNLYGAAATTTTITAGTGVDIDGDTANDDVINGGVSGLMTCWRIERGGNIRCHVSESVDAG